MYSSLVWACRITARAHNDGGNTDAGKFAGVAAEIASFDGVLSHDRITGGYGGPDNGGVLLYLHGKVSDKRFLDLHLVLGWEDSSDSRQPNTS